MTDELMQDWIDVVCRSKRPGALRTPQNVLVLDALKERINNALKQTNFELVIIPGGMTSQLQPLNMCLNKSKTM